MEALLTGLIPEDMPIKGPTKQSELFLGFESKIRSRRDGLLVQPAATLELDLNTQIGPSRRQKKRTVSSLSQCEMTSRTRSHQKPIPTRFARRSLQGGSEAIS